MEEIIKIWKTSREKFAALLEGYSMEQLNFIPEGFSNNLIWNIGHIVVAQQGLVYKGSDTPMHISEELFDKYKSGTKPDGNATESDRAELRGLLTSLIAKTEEDLSNGIFKTYHERTTGTGFHLANLQDALAFNNYHEGIHLGIAMSIRKFV